MATPLSSTLALTQLSQQTTAALANVTINFAVWKYEAPREYQPLKEALTLMRQQAAEEGNLHTTACKLGALFAPILPKIENLSKAYGQRASEIATSSVTGSKNGSPLGAFAKHAGVDGTTILAAATSGEAAVAVHLLACMLARQFRAETATAAWEEVVAERKQQIIGEPQTSVPLDTLMVSRLNITTQELATWDAGVRAWLATASHVERVRQKQLMLILDNVSGIIKPSATTYESIISAWHEVLCTMEKIVQGAAHVVQSGLLLLAISAWHIYPDITCLGVKTINVNFRDPLVTVGGAVTVGLLRDSPDALQAGIHWSLSLSRLRYYGDVETTKSIVNIGSSTVSLEDFSIVALGAVACHWTPQNTSLEAACSFFAFLDEYAKLQYPMMMRSWTNLFGRTASSTKSLKGSDRDYAVKLFKLGQRTKQLFESEDGCALFDMDHNAAHGVMQIFTLCNEVRHKVSLLRLAIQGRFPYQAHHMCIVSIASGGNIHTIDFATGGAVVTPEVVHLNEFLGSSDDPSYIRASLWHSLPIHKDRVPGGYLVKFVKPMVGKPNGTLDRFAWVDPPFSSTKSNGASYELRMNSSDLCLHTAGSRVPENFHYLIFQRISGDGTAAIFCGKWWKLQVPRDMWTLSDIREALQQGWLQCEELLSRMRKHIDSVQVFAMAFEALKDMPQMHISLSDVLNVPFSQHAWAGCKLPSWEVHSRYGSQQSYLKQCFELPEMSTAKVFAAIASLQAGVHDLTDSQMTDVMALSFKDSLFVVDDLLQDPYHASKKVVRIAGNIGRPGLALMIPPRNPRTRSSDPSRWSFVNHLDFDGNEEDNFTSTDMSIWFTDYEFPVQQNIGSGGKFIQAFYIECVVSVYDCGRWVADVDVVNNKQAFPRYIMASSSSTPGNILRPPGESKLVALDNWDEVLASENINSRCIARAHKNWLARLALATILQQKGARFVILPPEEDLDLRSIAASFVPSDSISGVAENFGRLMASSKETVIFIQ